MMQADRALKGDITGGKGTSGADTPMPETRLSLFKNENTIHKSNELKMCNAKIGPQGVIWV